MRLPSSEVALEICAKSKAFAMTSARRRRSAAMGVFFRETVEGISMLPLRAVAVVSLAFVAPIRVSEAQELARQLRPPAGFDIQAVTEGGRYVTLQNGSVWEVEISDRATTASWEAGTFVGIQRIWAPRNGYDWLLTRTENVDQLAAVKLVGRRPAAYEQ
jgi:hypothetical protein